MMIDYKMDNITDTINSGSNNKMQD